MGMPGLKILKRTFFGGWGGDGGVTIPQEASPLANIYDLHEKGNVERKQFAEGDGQPLSEPKCQNCANTRLF